MTMETKTTPSITVETAQGSDCDEGWVEFLEVELAKIFLGVDITVTDGPCGRATVRGCANVEPRDVEVAVANLWDDFSREAP